MRTFAMAGLVVTLIAGNATLHAQDMPEMPPPQKEHEWLHRFAGKWESEAELTMERDKPPMAVNGTESVRMLGGFWMVAEGRSEMMGNPFTYLLTLGYDTEKQAYVGTWVDSMTGVLWTYEGSVDASGNILTLEAEGPCPHAPGTVARFRDVIEFKSQDHRLFTSSMQTDEGEWTTMMTVNYRRKTPMNNAGAMKVTTPSDREIAMTRVFDAPREWVFDALTKCELIRQWLLGPPGWSMAVCEIDLNLGGAYRFVLRSDADGTEMGWGGIMREIVPPERFVVTESFDQPWYPGEALVTHVLVEQGSKTALTTTVRYESREARDRVLNTGMEQGVAASWDRLAELLASGAVRENNSREAKGE